MAMQLSPSTLRSHLPAKMPTTERLQVLNQLCGWINDNINQRAAHKSAVESATEDGMIGVVVSSTDCDWSRSVYSRIMPVGELNDYLYELYAEREGPTSYQLAAPSSLRDFRPSQRDLALEAFEAGHSHCVFA